ncbi:MAG: hypothetical protein K0Q66_2358 [Chitinophagaceae bacterium]|jgi:hypothetical protein|nr:hypothetical protein [Chitinophagaceae bacterium]
MNRLAVLLLLMPFISCERTIDPKLANQEPKLVVDAQVEEGQAPLVILTKSVGYFSTITAAQLSNTFVRNAVITISDGTRTHQLKEYAVPISGGTIYFYSNDPAQPLTAITGVTGKTYTLSIQAEGKTFTSSTTIPLHAKTVDSIWWKEAPVPEPGKEAVLWVRATDPPGYGNYIRYFTKKNSGQFLPGWYSVYDDQFVDGKTYDLQVDAGQDKNVLPDEPGNSRFFAKGDTVIMKFCNIDKATYDFWRTWEYSFGSVGNPFGSPITVKGNISNGALGTFSGYSVQYKTLIIPK